MEISYLAEFIKIAECGNYLEASDALFISQSSLSKHIQSLEKEVGASLFNRTTRKVTLSDAGEAFLPFAKGLVKDYEAALEAIRKSQSLSNKGFSLGVIPSIDSYGISDLVSNFMKENADTKIKLMEDDTSILSDDLKRGSCSLAFIYQFSNDPSLVSIPYASDSLVAVIPRGHPLASRSSVTLKELSKENLIVLKSHTVLFKASMASFKKAGLSPEVSFTERRFLSTFDLHESNGIALFFKRDATYVNNPGNIVVDIKPTISIKLNLCYPKKGHLTERELSFVKFVKKAPLV